MVFVVTTIAKEYPDDLCHAVARVFADRGQEVDTAFIAAPAVDTDLTFANMTEWQENQQLSLQTCTDKRCDIYLVTRAAISKVCGQRPHFYVGRAYLRTSSTNKLSVWMTHVH